MEDREFILESARRLERWENTPRAVPDGYADMSRDELIKLVAYLTDRLEESDVARKKEREESTGSISALAAQVSALTEQLRKTNEVMSAMATQLSEQSKLLREKDEKIAELQGTVKIGRRHLFDRKSQKGTRKKDDGNRPTPHTDVKDDFDGTPESLPGNLDVNMADKPTDVPGAPVAAQKEHRLYRLGKTNRTMTADNHVFHGSDRSKLPDGTVVIKTSLLDLMKSGNAPRYGSLMEKAVNYPDHFWNQVFLYRKDGDYTIDNSLAERCIQPTTPSCPLASFRGIQSWNNLKKFFEEIVSGNRDYGKLMPSTIGISANNL